MSNSSCHMLPNNCCSQDGFVPSWLRGSAIISHSIYFKILGDKLKSLMSLLQGAVARRRQRLACLTMNRVRLLAFCCRLSLFASRTGTLYGHVCVKQA